MPTASLINEIALVALGGLLAWAAIRDFRTFTIPNWLCASVAVLFIVHAFSDTGSVDWVDSLIAGFLMFLGGLALFGANLMGGGDVKLMAALGLWAGLDAILEFLVVTSLAGGVLALIVGSRHWLSRQAVSSPATGESGDQVSVRTMALPYGVAIACGGLYIAARLFVH